MANERVGEIVHFVGDTGDNPETEPCLPALVVENHGTSLKDLLVFYGDHVPMPANATNGTLYREYVQESSPTLILYSYHKVDQ